jgi:hypothetical protein
MSSIRKWLVPAAPFTHLLMDGGMLFVPMEDTDEFYRAYISDVTHGHKLFVVEQKTNIFKFFVDIDYKAKEPLSKEEIERICSAMNDVVDCGRCCIARTRPRACAEGIKTGVHIHWPDRKVTRASALAIRTKILMAFPDASEGVDWSKVIDASVYGGSGLRMIWSHKKPTGDPYIPWKMIGGTEYNKDFDAGMLDLFSIRTFEEDDDRHELDDEVTCSALEEFIRRNMVGQEQSRVKKIIRNEKSGGWYVQTDSRYCEKISDCHKRNHVWFNIYKGTINQRCFDEECSKFSGREHNLPPTIVEQLKDVAPVGSPPSNSILGILPQSWHDSFSFIC